MKPTGQKANDLTISDLKIFLKPQLFMMLQSFFLNAFPVYTVDSKDKPAGFNDDPEKAA